MSEEIKSMFSRISAKYDFMNTVISLGVHSRWRKKAVKLSGVKKGGSVIDCASGTGDLAFEFKKKVGKNGNVTAYDFCREMLDCIGPKSIKNGLNINTICGDITNMNVPDSLFDAASISFGIRNVDDPAKGLSEMSRVVKNGGKVVILETGKPRGVNGKIYRLYGKFVIPVLGKLFAKDYEAYKYFADTSGRFPYGDKFLEIMKNTGKLENCISFPQTFGVAYIYVGTVKKTSNKD